VDLIELRWRASEVVLLGATWVLAIVAPMVIVGMLPKVGNEFWILFAFVLAYFGFTGVRARRDGQIKSFFRRVTLPVVLFCASSVFVAVYKLV